MRIRSFFYICFYLNPNVSIFLFTDFLYEYRCVIFGGCLLFGCRCPFIFSLYLSLFFLFLFHCVDSAATTIRNVMLMKFLVIWNFEISLNSSDRLSKWNEKKKREKLSTNQNGNSRLFSSFLFHFVHRFIIQFVSIQHAFSIRHKIQNHLAETFCWIH